MPRAKSYPGKVVKNRRMGNRRMHWVRSYFKSGQKYGIYSDAMDVFVKVLAKRIRNHQQNVVVVEGNTGAGKSTLAIQLCYELAKQLKVPFSLEQDYIYSLADLYRKIEDPQASPINLIDEAVLIVNAKRSQTKESVDTVNLFNTMRSLGWTTIMCAPSIFQIDKTVRVVHVDYKVHCSSEDSCPLPGYGRGFFEVSKARRHEYSKSAEPYWVLQCTGVFGSLPPAIDAEYQPIKKAAQMRLIAGMARRHGYENDENNGDKND